MDIEKKLKRSVEQALTAHKVSHTKVEVNRGFADGDMMKIKVTLEMEIVSDDSLHESLQLSYSEKGERLNIQRPEHQLPLQPVERL